MDDNDWTWAHEAWADLRHEDTYWGPYTAIVWDDGESEIVAGTVMEWRQVAGAERLLFLGEA